MPFPILRASFVVLSEIISLLEPNEIVTASLCSNKVRCLLKNHYQRSKPSKWRLSLSSWGLVDITNCTTKNRANVIMAKHIVEFPGEAHKSIEFNEYKCAFEEGLPILYFRNHVFGTKMVVDYVADLFSLDIYGLIIDGNGIWAFDWINNRQEKLLGGMGLSKNPTYAFNEDKTVDNLLIVRNASSSDCVRTDSNVSDNVRFNRKLGPSYVFLVDSNAHWVTCDYLMNCNAIKLFVSLSKLSELELNSFLRHWRAGGSPRLAYLKVRFVDEDTYIENFDEDLEIVEKHESRTFRVDVEDDCYEIREDYIIQRQDGFKATINCGLGHFTMFVWHADKN